MMDIKLTFENKKPDKDGVWLWRIMSRTAPIGVIVVSENKVVEVGWNPALTYDVDMWWNILPNDTETYFVGR